MSTKQGNKPFHDRGRRSPQHYCAVIDSPVGRLGIRTHRQRLQGIDFLSQQHRTAEPSHHLAAAVVEQLLSYFENPQTQFSIPVEMSGTDFQCRVWQSLQDIAPGSCLTYSDVATRLGSGARAVGGACRSNPVPIVVPCHRVVARSGVGGYDGDWGTGKVNIKKWLLSHEGTI